MEFKTAAHQQAYEKTGTFLRELFGEMVYARSESSSYYLLYGSAMVNVSVSAWGESDSVVAVYSFVVTKPDLRPDLLLWMLKKNVNVRFGAFGVDDTGDILFQHAISGATMEKAELKASVMAVIFTSDESDDQIVARWGGQRASDR